MKIYGSTTSPYVRRLRLLMANDDYQFVNLDIFSEEGNEFLNKNNPTRKVPMLVDGEQVIFDSGVIFRYLQSKCGFPSLSWDRENLLTLINAANDSLVELFLCFRSGFDVSDDKLFFNLQHKRVKQILTELDSAVENGHFDSWDYASISLYCLIDWAMFRERASFDDYQNLAQFHQKHSKNKFVIATDPRL